MRTPIESAVLDVAYIPRTQTQHQAQHRETYLVGDETPHNVKLRGGRVQVKRLECVDTFGLERWRPVLDVPFPAAGATLGPVCDALGLRECFDRTRTYGQDELLSVIVHNDPNVNVIDLTKARAPITSGWCLGEYVTLTVDGVSWYSIAFEDVHPGVVYAVVRHFGLEGRSNVSYPEFLKRIHHARPSRRTSVGDYTEPREHRST